MHPYFAETQFFYYGDSLMALGQLINGTWTTDWTEHNNSGEFQRMKTLFQQWIDADGATDFMAEPNRYHLYISLGCTWAHRTAIVWQLKGLQQIMGLSIVDPVISEQGWLFSDYPGCIPDSNYDLDYLWQLYVKAAPNYSGRVTVPVLWDKKTKTIVNNESRQIIQMLNSEFDVWAAHPNVDFYPEALRAQIDKTLDAIYNPINNGVYKAGFASSQTAYEQAVTELFSAFDHWDQVLDQSRYLCGDLISLADWCLFTTLFRFDSAYYGLFKCNLKRLVDYPNLWAYCRNLYQQPGVSEVCNLNHVKRLYYAGLPGLNPNRIVPAGPSIDFQQPALR